jgi:hypothetical protein
MDEREAWRPKIFYSDGPAQGLPEPFPAPTHLRRKERSSHNRGALYVPGVGSGLQTQLYATVGPRRQSQNGEPRASLGVQRDTEDARRGKLSRWLEYARIIANLSTNLFQLYSVPVGRSPTARVPLFMLSLYYFFQYAIADICIFPFLSAMGSARTEL